MQHIIAGTDFSIASVNACKYAAMLAGKLGVKFTLFNLYDAPVVHEDKELERTEFEKSEKLMQQLLSNMVEEFPDLTIDFKLSKGAFIDELSELVKSKGHSILVFGIEPKSWIKRQIYGSHSTELAGKVNTPVIIVPRNYREHKLNTVAVAVDRQSAIYNSRLEELSDLLSSTGVNLHVVHADTSDNSGEAAEKSISINERSYLVQTVKSEEIEDGLALFCRKNNIDLLTILSKTHSVLENIFSESVTKRVAYTSEVPVLAIHI